MACLPRAAKQPRPQGAFSFRRTLKDKAPWKRGNNIWILRGGFLCSFFKNGKLVLRINKSTLNCRLLISNVLSIGGESGRVPATPSSNFWGAGSVCSKQIKFYDEWRLDQDHAPLCTPGPSCSKGG